MSNNLQNKEKDEELNESALDKVNGGVLWDGQSKQPDYDDPEKMRTAQFNNKII